MQASDTILFLPMILFDYPDTFDMPSSRDTIRCATARVCRLVIRAFFQHSCEIYRLRNDVSFSIPLYKYD